MCFTVACILNVIQELHGTFACTYTWGCGSSATADEHNTLPYTKFELSRSIFISFSLTSRRLLKQSMSKTKAKRHVTILLLIVTPCLGGCPIIPYRYLPPVTPSPPLCWTLSHRQLPKQTRWEDKA